MVNDKPSIPAYVDTLKKLEEYVSQYGQERSGVPFEVWESVDKRIAQFTSYYTSRDDIELKEPDLYIEDVE